MCECHSCINDQTWHPTLVLQSYVKSPNVDIPYQVTTFRRHDALNDVRLRRLSRVIAPEGQVRHPVWPRVREGARLTELVDALFCYGVIHIVRCLSCGPQTYAPWTNAISDLLLTVCQKSTSILLPKSRGLS
jgi:hypothetical protein